SSYSARILRKVHVALSRPMAGRPFGECKFSLVLPADKTQRSGRVAYCTGLENRRSLTGSGGSNPPSSANESGQAPGFPGRFCFDGWTSENEVFSEPVIKTRKRATRGSPGSFEFPH